MKKQNSNNPKTIALMMTATVGSLGFAASNITHAFSTTPSEVSQASVEDPASTPDTPQDSAALQSGSKNNHAPAESELAVDCDPFMPLPRSAIQSENANSALNPGRMSQMAPAMIQSRDMSPGILSLAPLESAASAISNSASDSPTNSTPELVGTLNGKKPCAVFRSDSKLAVVPLGASIGNWKVTAVSHSSVTIESGKHVVQLTLAKPHFQEPNPSDSKSSAAATLLSHEEPASD